jgi:hypothetical protein
MRKRAMTIRVCPPAALLAAGLALSGCVDVECPAEFDRPLSRERYCGHTGNVATPTTYYTAPNATALPPPKNATYTTTTVVTTPPGPPLAAPIPPIGVAPMPPPGQPTQIR